MQAKDYGTCIAGKVPEIERDMCLKEFLALKTCMENAVLCFPVGKCFISLAASKTHSKV